MKTSSLFRRELWRIAILLMFFSVPAGLGAQSRIHSQTPPIRFSHLTPDSGLSSHHIKFIHQGPAGFIWIGTSDGLNRYDGYTFRVFRHDPEDPRTLSNNTMNAFWADQEGILWLGTQRGLNRFDPKTHAVKRFFPDDPLEYNPIWSIWGDARGMLWVGTRNRGLYRFDKERETFVHYGHDPDDPHSLSSDDVRAVYEDSSKTLWVGTTAGLNRFDPETGGFTRFRHDPDDGRSLSHDMVRSLFQDRHGFLWVGTVKGLNRLLLPSGKAEKDAVFQHFFHDEDDPGSLSNDTVDFIRSDSRGIMWIGTYGGGVNALTPPEGKHRPDLIFTNFRYSPNNPQSLVDDAVFSFLEDRSGVLWFGTWQGISRTAFRLEKFSHYRHDPEDPDTIGANLINHILEDIRGNIWFGMTGAGLDRLDPETGKFTHYLPDKADPNSLGFIHVYRILEDREGILWLCTWGRGLDRLDPETDIFTHFRHDPDDPESISSNLITAIAEGRNGRLWVGSYEGGLNRLDRGRGTFVRYQHDPKNPNSLGDDRVMDLYKDREGILWICLVGGLDRFDPETEAFTHFRHNPDDPKSLGHSTVKLIHEDSRGYLWLGTDGGLDRFDPETGIFVHYTVKNGLRDNIINAVEEDDRGDLWISTNNGLSRLRFAAGGAENGRFRHFDRQDGLAESSFRLGSSCKSRTGELYFGGNNGFNRFHPDDVKDNPHIPPVVLTDFRVNNQSVFPGPDSMLHQDISYAEKIVLSHGQSRFEFEFSALDYTAPSRNRYAYRLEPFDKKWVFTDSTKRFARYTNLDPGRYRFHVKGSNNDGLWNEAGTAVDILILPPWWASWWFKWGMAALIIGLILCGYFLRVGALKTRRRELERLVAERTASLADREQTLGAILSASPVGIGLVQERKLGWANAAMYRILGYTSEELIGKSSRILYPNQAEYERAGQILYSVTDTDAICQAETKWMRKNGTVFDCDLRICPLDPSDFAKGLIAVAIDISDRKAAEKSLKQAKEKAEAADMAKSRFLAGISHELRTPLNAILGYAQLYMNRKTLEENLREHMEIICSSGTYLLTLISDILEFSSMDARKTPLYPAKIPLTSFLNGIVGMISVRAAEKGIDLRYETAPDLPYAIRADERRLRQVLLNLLNNAVKFTSQGHVALRIETVDGRVDSCRLCFEIEDTGPGISPDQIERVFLPFEQVGDLDQRAQGTGLGLAISRGLARMMRGDIQVESEPGRGSRFRFEAEFEREADDFESLPPVGRIVGYKDRPRTILIIDDNAENRRVLKDLLLSVGFRVETACGGMDGLQKAENLAPDLIFMDLIMPEMDGFEVIGKIHELEQLRDVPAIAVSASYLDTPTQEIIRHGFRGFLAKPIDVERLYSLLQIHLDLEWIKDLPEKKTDAEEADIIPPPVENLEALRDLVRRGLIYGVEKKADALMEQDPVYGPFALRVKEMVSEVEDEKLIEFIDKYLKREVEGCKIFPLRGIFSPYHHRGEE